MQPVHKPSICLSMIVKNEAGVIARCLDSVRPLISHWIIVDTGSTDGTQDIIRHAMRDLPGTLHERPWRDFAHNRSEALALARPLAAYSLVIDADDALEIDPGFVLPPLTADAYTLDIRDSTLVYPRLQLFSSRKPWAYRGVLHEFPACAEPHDVAHLGLAIRRNHDGARRKDPDCFRRDVAVLSAALDSEQEPDMRRRYMFYLAQSYRDAGNKEMALRSYLLRAGMDGWSEEVYVSLFEAAKLKEQLMHDDAEVLDLYARASALVPARVEALYGASRLCRTRNRYAEGYRFARQGLGKGVPQGALFANRWIYEVGLPDEFSVNAYWVERYDESLDAALRILQRHASQLSPEEQTRITGNAHWAWDRLIKTHKMPNFDLREPQAHASKTRQPS